MPASKRPNAAEPDSRARRVAIQNARTNQLLGVDFVPVRSRVAPPAVPAPASAPPTSAAPATAEKRESKRAALEELRIRHAAQSPVVKTMPDYNKIVFGDGDPDARLMFIGEAPGADEDKQGIPFVGRAGQKLNEMIAAMGLRREDVYIANILKVRPPNNRTPTIEEAELEGPYLKEQIAIIEPEVIVTLGKPAANYLLACSDAMGALRGRWHDYNGIPVMPTFHPAYLLRQYTVENRKKVWSDLHQALVRLGLDSE